MKKCIMYLLAILCLLVNISDAFGQDKGDKYRRNSLCPFFISSSTTNLKGFENVIAKALDSYELSDKFNNHYILGNRVVDINNKKYEGLGDSHIHRTRKMSWGQAFKSQLKETLTGTDHVGGNVFEQENLALLCEGFLLYHNIANQAVIKWFNGSETPKNGEYYNMDLIKERGYSNATELEKLLVKESVRGNAILEDAGAELIPNTFVTFTLFDIVYDDQIKQSGNTININLLSKSGVAIKARTFLFKLRWNEKITDRFLKECYDKSPSAIPGIEIIDRGEDFVKKVSYNSPFSFEYLGDKTSRLKVNTTLAKLTEEKMITAMHRAVDNTFSMLMDEYEEFRVKAPLVDVNGKTITAFVGLKEGVTDKSKFEVLQQVYDEERNRFSYKRVTTLTVDKNRIWDNRVQITGEVVKDELSVKANKDVDRTYFLGNTDEIAPGMLIRQIK